MTKRQQKYCESIEIIGNIKTLVKNEWKIKKSAKEIILPIRKIDKNWSYNKEKIRVT